jgi:hypothetical protein
MYPQAELNRLALYKVGLRRDIAYRRRECAAAAARVVRPLEWLDRAVAFLRRLSPLAKFAAVPLGFLVSRSVIPRIKILGPLLRWGPVAFAAVRGVSAIVRGRADAGLIAKTDV